MSKDDAEFVTCEGHGRQPTALACLHLAESQPGEKSIGFHWNCDDGGLVANCDDCEAEADDDGFLAEDYVLENFVLMCRTCFVELAAANGVAVKALEEAENAAAEATLRKA